MNEQERGRLRRLTPQEALFCEAYGNPKSEAYRDATKSAAAAGYRQPHNAAWRLRQRPAVLARLAAMGEMLAKKEPAYRAGPGRGQKGSSAALPPFDKTALADLGITKRESAEAQKLAKLPGEAETVTPEVIRRELWGILKLAREKKDYATASRCLELIGKTANVFVDTEADQLLLRKWEEKEEEEARRLAHLMLLDRQSRPGLPVSAGPEATNATNDLTNVKE